MNKKVWSLTKVFLKNSFQKTRNTKLKQISVKSKLGMYFLYIVLFVYLAGIFGFMSFGMIQSLMMIHQEASFIGLIFLAIAFLMLLQAIISGMNILYFSKDIEYVLPLPLKPREILLAKVNTILITQYATELIIAVVPLLLYGIMTGAGLLYYILALAFIIVFPILPILLGLLVIMIIMSFAKIAKNREKFQTIVTFLSLIFVFIVSFSINGNNKMTEEQMAQTLLQANSMVEMLEKYFPTLLPTIKALTSTNFIASLIELVKVIVITAVAYFIFMVIGQKLYFKGAIGNSVGNTKKEKLKITDKIYKRHAIFSTYVKKEMKILFRNPIFFLQCVLPSVLMPILMLGISAMSILSSKGDEVAQLMQLVKQGVYTSMGACIVLVLVQFFSMMLYTSVTAISRDGLNATFMKYIPIPLYQQLQYKAIPNLIFYAIETIVTLIVFWLITKASIFYLLMLFACAMIIGCFTSYLMLLVDLKKPKLEWDTEYAVVKQNMNLMWPAVVGMVLIGLLIFGCIFIPNTIIYLILISLVFILAIFILNRYIKKNQTKLFEKVI